MFYVIEGMGFVEAFKLIVGSHSNTGMYMIIYDMLRTSASREGSVYIIVWSILWDVDSDEVLQRTIMLVLVVLSQVPHSPHTISWVLHDLYSHKLKPIISSGS